MLWLGNCLHSYVIAKNVKKCDCSMPLDVFYLLQPLLYSSDRLELMDFRLSQCVCARICVRMKFIFGSRSPVSLWHFYFSSSN